MKTIAQKIKEILHLGHGVKSEILGCMGNVEKVIDNNFVILLGRSKGRSGGGFTMQEKLNSRKYALKKVSGRWILGNRKTYSQKLSAKCARDSIGHAFKNWGI